MIITQEVFMEIRNLESFIQVAELGSFTKAAESLGYTQSSVSTQIRQLEKELGIPLFERINHRVRLTEKGKEKFKKCKKIAPPRVSRVRQ